MRVVPGMKDFFGKKLGSYVYNAMSHLSPVEIRTGTGRALIDRVYGSHGMMGAGKVAMRRIRRGLGNAEGYSFGDWFSGHNVGDTADTLSKSLRQTRAAWRIGTGATFGVAALSSVVAPGNPLDVTSRSAIQLGGHTMAAAALGSVNPYAGAAYAGWAGLNMIRPGNNMGPF